MLVTLLLAHCPVVFGYTAVQYDSSASNLSITAIQSAQVVVANIFDLSTTRLPSQFATTAETIDIDSTSLSSSSVAWFSTSSYTSNFVVPAATNSMKYTAALTTSAALLSTISSSDRSTYTTNHLTTQSGSCAGSGTLTANDQKVYTFSLTSSVLTAFSSIYDVQYIRDDQTYYSPSLVPRRESTTCLPCLQHVLNCGYGPYTQDPRITYVTPVMLSSVQYVPCFGKSITLTSLASYPESAFLDSRTCIRQATIIVSYDYTSKIPNLQTNNDIFLQSFDACTTTITYVADLQTKGSCTATYVGAVNPLLDPNKLQVRVTPAAVTLADVPATQTPEQQVASSEAEASSTPTPTPQSPEQQVIATETTPASSPQQSAAPQSDAATSATSDTDNTAQVSVPNTDAAQNSANQATDSNGQGTSQNEAQSQASSESVSTLSSDLASSAQAAGSAAQQALQDSNSASTTGIPADAANAIAQLSQSSLPTESAVRALQAVNTDLANAAATASGSVLSQILAAESSISSVLQQINQQATATSLGAVTSVVASVGQAGSTHLSTFVYTSTGSGVNKSIVTSATSTSEAVISASASRATTASSTRSSSTKSGAVDRKVSRFSDTFSVSVVFLLLFFIV